LKASAQTERERANIAFPVRNGVFIAVVGPSGAGKDTIIRYARQLLAEVTDVHFVRRVITRPSDASSEEHESVDDAAFEEARRRGDFSLSWSAHGLMYALPASVDATIAGGRVAVANLSRGALPALRGRYANVAVANVAVVEITARPEILADRLAARGRESRGEVLTRLARTAPVELGPGLVSIDNSGPRKAAGEQFVALVRKAMARADTAELSEF
jgi:ribose 1,5-bisphosphokinase